MAKLEDIEHGSQWLLIPIGTAILAIFLPLSDLGYLALKLIVCCSAIYALRRVPSLSPSAVISLICVAVLFNPIIPVYLRDRTLWIVADLFAIATFFFQIKFSKKNSHNIVDVKQGKVFQTEGPQLFQTYSQIVEKSSFEQMVVNPIRAILSNFRNIKKIEEMDEGRLRGFLGYCTGFILFNHDPKSASYFVNAGMWVKQSYWGVISKKLPALLNDVCNQEQLSILLKLGVEGIILMKLGTQDM